MDYKAYSHFTLDLDSPFLPLVRAARIFFLLSCLFLSVTLMKFLPKPIPPALLVWLNESGFIADPFTFGLPEPYVLTRAIFLLVVAVMFLVIILGSKRLTWIILLGILTGYLYLLRPQAIVAFILLGMVLGWLLLTQWKQKRIRYAVIISLMIAVGEASIPSLVTWYGTGVLTPSNIYNELRWAFALQLATEADVALMPNEMAKEALREGLRVKQERNHEIESFRQDPKYLTYALSLNEGISYGVWGKLLAKYPNLPNMERPSGPMMTVANVVLANHFVRFLKEIFWPQFQLATTAFGSAITKFANFYLIVILILTLAMTNPVKIALCVWSLVATHLMNMVVVVSFAAPYNGYLIMTEFMLPLALVISLWGVVNRLYQYKPYSRS